VTSQAPKELLQLRGSTRSLFCCAASVVVIAASLSVNAQAPGLEVVDRVVVASKIFALVQQHFAHWEGTTPTEMESAYRQYVSDTLRADTRHAFDRASLRFVARLRNGHTQFFDNQADSRPLKFRLLEVEGQWVVIASRQAGLTRGTVVRAIGGQPIEDFVREAAQYVHASNDRLARTHVFSYTVLFPEKVSLDLGDGGTVVVDRSAPDETPIATPARVSEGRWLRGQEVAYIRVPSFGDAVYEKTAIDLVRQYANAPTLVVDVRGNGGGTTPQQLIAALMNRPWRTWQEVIPQPGASGSQAVSPTSTVREGRPQAPTPDAYAGRLFLLIDRFCGSACEDFVMPFKDTGRAVVVGETTQGSSGNPYRADIGYGISVAIGARRYRFPDGTAFEGVGIAPDVPVERRVADLVAGRDAVLERAQGLAAQTR
jgi:carboxyl-terminal processing protease